MKLTILSESHPKRCEVCHQSDCFDPAANICDRCTPVEMPLKNIVTSVSVPVPQFCLLSDMTPDEIEDLPTVAQVSAVLSFLHLLLFYLNYCLMVLPITYKQYLFRSWLFGGFEFALFLSFFGAWILGLICFRTAWDLYPNYKEYRIFFFAGLVCFWPTIHLVIIFVEGGVGLLGSDDFECFC
ncbi:MAG: hypothetical protein HY774_08105 [Acidobacteria bacterium]|nr:hypothetical protein [Acidobacteriota bacterium]